MPELPEVETIRQEIAPWVVERTIDDLVFYWPPVAALPPAQTFVENARGRRIREVGRRGKFLYFILEGPKFLFIHFRMTGQLHREPLPLSPDPLTRAVIVLNDAHALRFRDQRKFGRFYLVDDPDIVVGELGPEPLAPDWTADDLQDALRKRRAPVKAVLLDQRVVAGLGNIYADEALFLAGIHPCRPAQSLDPRAIERLHAAIRQVLAEAIRQKGTTMQSYVRPGGQMGGYQQQRRVYQRVGQPCPRCHTPVQRCRVHGRSSHFCPVCQPL